MPAVIVEVVEPTFRIRQRKRYRGITDICAHEDSPFIPEITARSTTSFEGHLLSVDWLLDRFRTTVNVFGDAAGSAVVERSFVVAGSDP